MRFMIVVWPFKFSVLRCQSFFDTEIAAVPQADLLLKDDRLPSRSPRHVGAVWARLWSRFYGDTRSTRSLSEAACKQCFSVGGGGGRQLSP